MASARYWKISSVETNEQGANLVLSEVALYESGVRQTGATVTTTVTPSSGAIANLSDADDNTTVTWTDSHLPGFAIHWDFGSAKDITKIGIKGPAKVTFPLSFQVLYSADDVTWTLYGNITWSKWTNASTYFEIDVTNGNPDIANTVVHLHCDGVVGAKHVRDTGTASLVCNLYGEAKLIADATAYNGMALQINSAAQGDNFSNYLYSASSVSALSFSGAFTICVRLYAYGYSSQYGAFIADTFNGGASNGTGWHLVYGDPNNSNKVYFSTLGSNISSDAACPLNQWVEIMITRDGSNVVRMFINGTLQTANMTVSGATGATQFRMGRSYNDIGRTGVHGLVDEFFVINGTALATASYTPSGAALADSLLGPTVMATDPVDLRSNTGESLLVGSVDIGDTSLVPYAPTVLHDMQDGGRYKIQGTVKEKALPDNLPVHRRVRLFNDKDARFIREVWSDATTGAYAFEGIRGDTPYLVIAEDYTHLYDPVGRDNVTAGAM